MNVTVEIISSVSRKLTVTIPADQVSQELARAYQTMQKDTHLKGFRPGKAPRSLLESRFGSQVSNEIRTKLISDSLERVVAEHELMVVSQPQIEPGKLVAGSEFVYVAHVETKPEIVAMNYKGLPGTRDRYALDESKIDKRLEELREQKGNLTVIEEQRPLEMGDVARIEYTMSIEGRLVDQGKTRNGHVTMQNGAFLPGMAEAIVGMTVSEKRSVHLDIAADFRQQNIAGRHLDLDVTLMDVKRLELPNLDDDFAKDLDYENLDALRSKIRADLVEHLNDSAEMNLRRSIIERLIEGNPMELPPSLVNQQMDLLIEEQFHQSGRPLPKGKIQLTDEIRDALKAEAELRLRGSLILESISEQENISVNDQDLHERLLEIAQQTSRRVEAVKGEYTKHQMMDDLREKILEDKTLKFVIGEATITDVDRPFADHAHDHEH